MHKRVKQNIIVHFINQKLKNKHFPQKVYKLSKAKFAQFDRTRGDKKPDISHLSFFALGMYNDQRSKSQKCALGTIKNCASNGLLSICISVPIMVLPWLPGIWHATGSKCTDQN